MYYKPRSNKNTEAEVDGISRKKVEHASAKKRFQHMPPLVLLLIKMCQLIISPKTG